MFKISVITVVLNARVEFENTLKSIVEQRRYGANIEIVVIDGGSKDGTLQIAEKFRSEISSLVSEPDGGIYYAMNKGIRLATGDALVFINAGDVFVGEVLTRVYKAPSLLRVKYKDILGRERAVREKNRKIAMPYCHQGIVFPRADVEYNTKFLVSADYRFFLDYNFERRVEMVSAPGYVYFTAGFSERNYKLRDREIFEIRRAEFGSIIGFIYEAPALLKRIIRIFLRKS